MKHRRAGGKPSQVAQISKSAVSPISQSAGLEMFETRDRSEHPAGWKHSDTAGWENLRYSVNSPARSPQFGLAQTSADWFIKGHPGAHMVELADTLL